MAKEKLYWYECVRQVDLKYWGPEQRKERWTQRGPTAVQPQRVQHWIRLYPSGPNVDQQGMSRGYADYAVFRKPLANHLTMELTKKVSRSIHYGTNPGQFGKRKLRAKVTKTKMQLLEPDEVTESIKRRAYDMDWDESLFKDQEADQVIGPPGEVAEIESQEPEEQEE